MTLLERVLKLEKQLNTVYCKIENGGLGPSEQSPHNELEDLQGGQENEYYHLNKAQYEGLHDAVVPVTSEFTVTKGAGRFDNGETFPSGQTLAQAFQLLLTDTYFPTFVPPSLSLTSNIGNREVGETLDLILTANFNRGIIKGNTVNGSWDYNVTQNPRAGTPSTFIIGDETFITTNTSQNKIIASYIVPLQETIFNGGLSFSAGPQPKDSEGLNYSTPLGGGSLVSSTTVVGYQRRYSGSINTFPNDGQEIRTKLLGNSVLNTANNFSFTTGTTDRIFVVAIPNNKTMISAINVGTNENLMSGFNLTGINVIPDANNDLRPYKVYIMENAIPFSNNYQINVIIN